VSAAFLGSENAAAFAIRLLALPPDERRAGANAARPVLVDTGLPGMSGYDVARSGATRR
jgi:hypothetical protein